MEETYGRLKKEMQDRIEEMQVLRAEMDAMRSEIRQMHFLMDDFRRWSVEREYILMRLAAVEAKLAGE